MSNGNGKSALNTISGAMGLVMFGIGLTLSLTGGAGLRERVARVETALELLREDTNRRFDQVLNELRSHDRDSNGGG